VAAISLSSGCGATLQRKALPLDPELAQLEQGEHWCLEGGEDFELVLALEPSWAEALMQRLPGSQHIGSLTGAAGDLCWQESGAPLAKRGGFSHFA
jgi:thiamine-monophosphate kinase